jgi:hypothetical protein
MMTVQHNVVQPGILLWLEADTFWTVPQGRDISTGMENAIEDTIKKIVWVERGLTHTHIYININKGLSSFSCVILKPG